VVWLKRMLLAFFSFEKRWGMRSIPVRGAQTGSQEPGIWTKPHKSYAVQEGDATMMGKDQEPGPKKQLWQSLNFGKVIREAYFLRRCFPLPPG